MKAVLKKTPTYYCHQIPINWDQIFQAAHFPFQMTRGALDLAISLAQGSFIETQLVYFPGQQGFRNSTATQHGATIYKSCKHLMYAAALFQEQASDSTQSHQSLLAPATRDLNRLHQTIQSGLMHLFPNGRRSTRLIRLCALSCEYTDPILIWHWSQPTC